MTSNHKITATCKKYILRVLVALAIVVLFHPLLNALFAKMLGVLPIEFGQLYVDVAIVGLTLLGAVFISLKWIEKHKFKLFVIWGFGVFLHLLDTFYWQDWDYAPMSFPMINYVAYFLYILPFVFVVKSIVEKAHYSRIEETKEDKLNDSFGYTVHAKKLLEFIKNRKSRDSYAIGINAKWGEGKSFFIDLFKEELANSKSGKELIVVDFKPWFSHSPLDIINDFFTVFGERLEEEGIFIQSDLEKYKEALMGVETEEPILNQLLKSVKELFDNDSKSSSLLYERINNVLKEENRRIIVVIDDLDRLTKEELFEVIKLVRNSGSLKNTFFVLAYDRTYLEESLESLQIGKHDKYLEKVIQMELSLPIITAENYESYANSYIKKKYGKEYAIEWNDICLKVFGRDDIINFIDQLGEKGVSGRTNRLQIFNRNFCNIRYVENFLDKAFYGYLGIKDEVNLLDFVLLALLKDEDRYLEYDFVESMCFILECNNKDKITTFLEERYNSNQRVIKLFEKLILYSSDSEEKSFMYSSNRKYSYINTFIDEEAYVTENIFKNILIGENNLEETIDLLLRKESLTQDFFIKIRYLSRYSYLLDQVADLEQKGKDLIYIFNELEFKNGIKVEDYQLQYLYSSFLSNLEEMFCLNQEELIDIFYGNRFISLKRLKVIISCFKGDYPFSSEISYVNFFKNNVQLGEFIEKQFVLALNDQKVCFENKLDLYVLILQIDIEVNQGKINSMMLEFFNSNIEELRKFLLLISEKEYGIKITILQIRSTLDILFPEISVLRGWIDKHNLAGIKQINYYIELREEKEKSNL